MKLNICFGVFLVIGIAVCVVALLSKYTIFPEILDDRIEESVRLINGTNAYERWKILPMPMIWKIYFFNITNPDDVSRGKKPILKEIGPYIYRQLRSKFDITGGEDTLSYRELLLFEFDENSSLPLTDSDEIHIVNLPLVAIIDDTVRKLPSLLQFLNKFIPIIFDNPRNLFLKTTPKNFLFDGIIMKCNSSDIYLILVCKLIEKFAPRTIVKQNDGNFKFSFMNYKNNTDEGKFVVNNGKSDVKSLGKLSSWDGYNETNIWLNEGNCNEMFGTDATIYPPFQNYESIIDTFSVDICRRVALEYSQVINYFGVDGLRFTAKKLNFLSPINTPENQCYCLEKTFGILGDDGCLYDGAVEMSTCHGAPIVFTHPHFYMTDKRYQMGVDGLKPDAEKHENYIDLEPATGTPLRGSKRAQFNIFIRPVINITLTSYLNTTLMPILWFDEGLELNDELINELNIEYFDNLRLLEIIGWVVLACGGAILIINIIVFLCCRKITKQ